MGTAYGFGLFVDNTFAGEINLNNVVRGAFQCGIVGYWIDQRHAGNRYIAEGVAVLCRFAFDELHLHRLEICIVPRNTNSRRVMEVLGIREEGVALRYLEINGAWEDHIRYAITAEEWRARRAELSTWLSSLAARRDYSLAMRNACAFALRSVVRRFHIFIFQWRLPSLPLPGLAPSRRRDGATAPRPGRARAPRLARNRH